MLNQTSWTDYLLILLAGVLLYYLWFGFYFYRREALSRFLGRSAAGDVKPIAPAVHSVMGAVAADPEQAFEAEDLVFSGIVPDETVDLETGQYPDPDGPQLIREAEALIGVIAESAEPKAHFLLLAGLLAEKYAQTADAESVRQVCERFLDPANGFAFQLNARELTALWDNPVHV